MLLGVGHTNAHVVKMWRMKPLPDASLTCVSNFPIVTYSGMLPGVLAGQYQPARMEIDLVRLCSAVGAKLIVDEVTGLDVQQNELLFAHRPPLPFDVLSIGVGSVPRQAGVELDDTVLAIKPMQTFLERLHQKLARIDRGLHDQPRRPLRVAVVGAGIGGVEISFCLAAAIRKSLGELSIQQLLVDGGEVVAGGTLPKTQQGVRSELDRRGIQLLLGRRVHRVKEGQLSFEDGTSEEVDIVIWATNATAPPLLAKFELPKDERGFLLTRASLRTTADLPIFAVGDSGTIEGSATPKAGVYAVRQGPVLWRNIPRLLAGQTLEEYQPQQNFLKLLNTGNGKAFAEFRGMTFQHRWCWSLKDYIDGRFMDMFQDYKPMEMSANGGQVQPPMRCAGCGGKVSGSVLSRVLQRLEIPASEHVVLGLEHPDDAAIVRPPGGRPITITADFFAAPLADPYLSGRVAALNSASDLFACGAKPIAALALATIPVGRPRQQEQLLYELLAGSLYEFRQMGATLVGGHTIEGPQLTIGFTMLADQGDDQARTKGQLRVGDQLLLSKPLGTGVLLVGQMQGRCKADWWQPMLDSMLLSNQFAAELAARFNTSGMTDVTGFGLAGHLHEMLKASHVDCVLRLSRMPLLPGAATLLAEGLESTLAPANRSAEEHFEIIERYRGLEAYQALFDPQTGGGMLMGVAAEDSAEMVRLLSENGHVGASVIGEVTERQSESPTIRFTQE